MLCIVHHASPNQDHITAQIVETTIDEDEDLFFVLRVMLRGLKILDDSNPKFYTSSILHNHMEGPIFYICESILNMLFQHFAGSTGSGPWHDTGGGQSSPMPFSTMMHCIVAAAGSPCRGLIVLVLYVRGVHRLEVLPSLCTLTNNIVTCNPISANLKEDIVGNDKDNDEDFTKGKTYNPMLF